MDFGSPSIFDKRPSLLSGQERKRRGRHKIERTLVFLLESFFSVCYSLSIVGFEFSVMLWIMEIDMNFPTLKEITAAAARIKPYIHRTPVLTCSALDEMCDAQFFFKCENFQKVGAFKFRGACNAVFSLEQEKERFGVATQDRKSVV